jgi:hypothetical protein
MDVAGWCAIAIVVSMVFMGLTYAILPTSATARHYLTTAPMVGFVLVSVRKFKIFLVDTLALTVQSRPPTLSPWRMLLINVMI